MTIVFLLANLGVHAGGLRALSVRKPPISVRCDNEISEKVQRGSWTCELWAGCLHEDTISSTVISFIKTCPLYYPGIALMCYFCVLN